MGTAAGYEEESQWAEEQDLHQKDGALIKLHHVAQNCYGANAGIYSHCFRVLQSHCGKRFSPLPHPLQGASSRVPPVQPEPLFLQILSTLAP